MTRLTGVCFAVALVSSTAAGSGQSAIGPRNDLPQPYRTTRDWGQLPPGLKWAAVTAVEPSPDGSIYVVHRCFANSCANRKEAPILKFDANGRLLASWGAGMFIFPHGGTVDRDGNLWITDARGENGIGHQVFKFSPGGKVLMTLGKAGVSGSGPALFDQPTDVVVAPNGDIFVTDSHRNGKNNRIVHLDKDGKFIKEWGKKGSGRGELSEPHTIAMDSRGRLFVGDRENNRIQIFDQAGRHLDEWRQFGRPSGIAITSDDTIYVADSESGPDTGARELPGIRKGIRIGSARDGRVTAFIEDSESTAPDHSGAEGVGVDAQGNVYGAVVRRQMLERHLLQRQPAGPDWEGARRRMVDEQLAGRDIRSPRVLDAMRTVPRHLFVPEAMRASAYIDSPLPIGYDQTISQPYIVAYMTEALELEPAHKVLEIGTGSGYQAAILGVLSREVYTIEIVGPLAERARQTLAALGHANVHVRAGNGYLGWPEQAPFDRVMVTAAPDEVPPALVEQLKVGGLMAIPVGTGVQELRILRRTKSGMVTLRTLPVRFVPMTGKPKPPR